MEQMTIKETVSRWGVTTRQVHSLCEKSLIDGMAKLGDIWVIPKDITISIPRYAIAVLLVYVVVLSPIVVYAQGSTNKEDLHIGTPAEYITFNQYIDNKVWGDEHDFVRVGPTYIKSISDLKENIVAVEGQEYYIYMYVHNNAASWLNHNRTEITPIGNTGL
jgi:hypothetical protein